MNQPVLSGVHVGVRSRVYKGVFEGGATEVPKGLIKINIIGGSGVVDGVCLRLDAWAMGTYAAQLTRSSKWWSVWIPEIEYVTQGRTLTVAVEMTRDLIVL